MKFTQNIPLKTLTQANVRTYSFALADLIDRPTGVSAKIHHGEIIHETPRPSAILWASSWYAFELAYQFLEEGSLKLESTLSEILPFLQFNDASQHTITVEDVLRQTTNLPNAFSYGFFTSKPDRNFLKYLVKTSRSFRQNPRNAKLNVVDLSLLEMILEKVSGMDYARLFESKIVKPHGFHNTLLCDEVLEGTSNLQKGKQRFYFNALAFAGVLADANEFAAFTQHFQSTLTAFHSKYSLDTSAWFNGFSVDQTSNYLYVTYQDIHSFALTHTQGRTFVANLKADQDLLPLLLDEAYPHGFDAMVYTDVAGETAILENEDGLFAGKGKILTRDEMTNDGSFVKVAGRSYRQETTLSEQGIRITRTTLQKLDSVPSITWWHSAQAKCILTRIHPGENLVDLEWLLHPVFRKEAPNTMLWGPVYHVVDSHLALPGVDLPSDWDNDTEELRHEESSLIQGMHEYSPIHTIPSNLTQFRIEDNHITWTRSRKNLDSLKLIGTIVMIIVDAQGKLCFDSRKSTGLLAFEEEMYYGFFGKKDSEVLATWENDLPLADVV